MKKLNAIVWILLIVYFGYSGLSIAMYAQNYSNNNVQKRIVENIISKKYPYSLADISIKTNLIKKINQMLDS